MKWLRAVADGNCKLYTVFWIGFVGFAILNILYLRITGVAIVYQANLFTSPMLEGKTSLELLLPALFLLVASPIFGLYTTLAAAGIWQAADRYPGRWPLWPNLSFFLVMLGVIMAAVEIIFGVSVILESFSKVCAAVAPVGA